MGIKPRISDPADVLTLEHFVPADHFYRHLERTYAAGSDTPWWASTLPCVNCTLVASMASFNRLDRMWATPLGKVVKEI